MSHWSSILTVFTLGAAAGAGVLALLQSRTDTPQLPAMSSVTPMTDLLNGYACRKAETKHVRMGGVEDAFSATGEETRSPGDLQDWMDKRTGSRGGIAATRGYDEAGMDNAFVERIADFPDGIVHGIVALRLRRLGSTNNDHLALGDLVRPFEMSHIWSVTLSENHREPGWRYAGDVMSATLAEVVFPTRYDRDQEPLPQTHRTLRDFLRNGARHVDVVVSDDTMVDAVGFAVCTEPPERRGTTFIVQPLNIDGVSFVSCNPRVGGQDHCDFYAGDTLCSQQRPLACFSEGDLPVPEMTPAQSKALNGLQTWSGGRVAFTEPLAAGTIPTQAQGHALCRTSFGPSWRMANIHDGQIANAFAARADSRVSGPVWIDSNLEPYGNCWALTQDYGTGDE